MIRSVPAETAMHYPVSIPPYARLADRLRSLIREHSLAPGAGIGTEVQLAHENGLSRMTARRAVQVLVDEGLVERRAGRGVFVRCGDDSARRIVFLAGDLLWMPPRRHQCLLQTRSWTKPAFTAASGSIILCLTSLWERPPAPAVK